MPLPIGPSDLVRRQTHLNQAQTNRINPNRTELALIDGPVRLGWAELDEQVTRAALALRAAGPQPGDRVTLSLGTTVEFVLLYLGALRAGLIAVPVNPACTGPELEHIRSDCGARLHITSASAAELLAGAPSGPDPRADRTGEAAAALLYTSSSGARPRGAILSSRALMANLDQLAAVEPALLSAEDVLLLPLPLTHVFGLNAGLGLALHAGATTVLADRFDPVATLATMAAERVTAVVGVPGQYAAWLQQPQVAEAFASVRFAMSGSATLTRTIVDGFGELGVVLHDGYGLTEAAPVVALDATDAARPGSVGRPIPGVEVELRDAGGVVEDRDPGQVFIRGANLFSGYWPLGEDGPDADGWFGTGDVAVQDGGGGLHLVGRSAELIVVEGFNVYPAEVEAVLAAEPGVAEVAVVGGPPGESGAAVLAYVVPAAGTVLRPEELLAAAARSLARFKLPRIEVVTTLPRTVTGKVMKWALGADRGRD